MAGKVLVLVMLCKCHSGCMQVVQPECDSLIGEHWKDCQGQVTLVGWFSIFSVVHDQTLCFHWKVGPSSSAPSSVTDKDFTVIMLFGVLSTILSPMPC